MLLCWNREIGSKDSHIGKMLSFLPSLVEGLGCYIWEWVTQGLCWKAVIPGILFPAHSTDFALGMRSRDSLGRRSFWQWERSNEGWTENSKWFINSLCCGIVMHGLECLDRDPEKSFCLFVFLRHATAVGFPDSSVGKESTCNAGDPSFVPELGRSPGEQIGYPLQYSWASLLTQLVKKDLGLIPGLGRAPGEGKSYPLQYSGLEISMDCIVYGVTKSQTHWATFTFMCHGM